MSNNPGFKKVPALDLATINKRLNDLWGGIANSGGGTVSPVFTKKTILTDAQIKALPSTPVEILPTPVSGKVTLFLGGVVVLKVVDGYGNVGAADSLDNITVINSNHAFFILPSDFAANGSFSNPGTYTFALNPNTQFTVAKDTDRDVVNGVYPAGYPLSTGLVIDDIQVFIDNYTQHYAASLGDFTGGDPANTMAITLFYSVVDL